MHEVSLYSGMQIQNISDEQKLQDIVFGKNLSSGTFTKPYDITSYFGRLYITDTMSSLVHVLDVPNRHYFYFGYRKKGKLNKPTGITVDDLGMVYVTDTGNRRVQVYDSLGLFQRNIGGKSYLSHPVAVTVDSDSDHIYVVDNGGVSSNKHRVVVFNMKGKYLFSFGHRGKGLGEFNLPADITTAEDGTIYVLDAGNFRVQVFDSDGNFIRSWGGIGKRAGNFARPRRMAIDKQGYLYISDGFFNNVQIFNSTGNIMLAVGQQGNVDGPGKFSLIAGLWVDETGRLYVIDQLFRKIEVFRPVKHGFFK